jgi:peptide/nickel transport system substrate-binding protein
MSIAGKWLGRIAGIALAVGAVGATAQAADKTLRAVVHADLKILDTTWTTTYITNRYGYLVYDTLFAINSKFEPKPQMVDTYSLSDDKLTYTFTLRKGMKFHDGQPVRAADCIASLKRWMVRDVMGQGLAKVLQDFEVVDDLSFRMRLKEPYGLVLETLGKPTTPAYIMPERIASLPINQQTTDSIGSGPFIMKRDEWRPGNKAVFVRNPDYIPRAEPADYLSGGKIAKLDRVEWLYIPDNNTTLSALMAGEIDYFEAPPLDFIKPMMEDKDLRVLNIDKLGVQFVLRPNSLNPPFNNIKAREALLYLDNQEEVMQAVVGNPDLYLKFCGAFFMCGSGNETAVGSEPLRKPDYARAKALLAEGGYKGEKLVVLLPTDRPQYAAATMVLASALRKAGAAVDLQSGDWSTISVRRARKDPLDKGGYNIFITSQGGPDPSNPVANTWFNAGCERANPGWLCDPELEALVTAWTKENDTAKRRAMIETIQARAYVAVPYVPYGQFFQPIAFRANVTGVLVSGMPVYWNIDKQ